MIKKYHRPKTLETVLQLLEDPNMRPLGGGTFLNQPSEEAFEVVDLQAIGLDKIRKVGNRLIIGATVPLQALLESPYSPLALKATIKLEAPLNLRNVGTVAGALVTSNGRSPFATVMLALDARLTIAGCRSADVALGDLLPLRAEFLRCNLITKIEIPLNIKLAYEYVSRSPADKPIVCTALVRWPSDRIRLVVGGWGQSPCLALDGKDISAVERAASGIAQEADDEWASAEYRSDISAVLAKRCMQATL